MNALRVKGFFLMPAEKMKEFSANSVVQWVVYALFTVTMALIGFGVKSIQGDVTEIKTDVSVIEARQLAHLTNHPSIEIQADIAVLESQVRALESSLAKLEQ